MTNEAERPSRVGGRGYIDRRLTGVGADTLSSRQEMAAFRQETPREISTLRQEMRTPFYWLVGLLVTVLAAVVGLAVSIITTG
ncbi:MAG: hypothetical protein ACK4K2_06635 [Dehalococcoidia bacterium]